MMEGDREPRIELLHPLQVEAYRSMTPEERIAAGRASTRFVRERLRAHYAGRHPEWTESEIRSAVARRWLGLSG